MTRNIFVEESCTKCGGETSPKPSFEKQKLSISLDVFIVFIHFVFIICPCRGLSKHIENKTLSDLELELVSLLQFLHDF